METIGTVPRIESVRYFDLKQDQFIKSIRPGISLKEEEIEAI